MELSGNLSNNSNHLAGYLKHQKQNQKQMKSIFPDLRWALFVPTSCFLLKVAVTKLSHGAHYLKIFVRNDTATRNELIQNTEE